MLRKIFSRTFVYQIISDSTLKRIIPLWLKFFIRRRVSFLSYDKYVWSRSNPYDNFEPISSYQSEHPFTLGIIKEMSHFHQHYIAACREIKVSYKILDISGTDWIDVVQHSNCDAFLVWPSAILTIWKQMYDDRLRIMVKDLGKIICSTYDEIWLWESKQRMRDWLIAHKIPHPKTEVFYDIDEVLDFLERSELPLVIKVDLGSSSRGVKILKDKRKAVHFIYKAFKKGIVVDGGDPRDRQWGSILLQEYLPEAKEWRMVRIGDSYFGHPKGKAGEFHSGSGKVLWENPPVDLLNFLRYVTDTGNFTSMNVDVFETSDGRYLVNELQTVFGASYSKDQLKVNGEAGRYIYNKKMQNWIFEKGDFARNACANLRVEHLLKILYGLKRKKANNEDAHIGSELPSSASPN